MSGYKFFTPARVLESLGGASIAEPEGGGRVSLPPEVHRFFAEPVPKTLTVRGPPGSGKTTFALSALTEFPGARIYVTSTVPREGVLRQYPWIASTPGPEVDFVEFLRFRTPSRTSGLSVDQMREVLQARASDLVDLASVLSLPSVLYDKLSSGEPGGKMVVFDSWEGWVENLLGGTSANLDVWTTRWVLERSILDQVLRTGAHAIMVVERDERNRFDYSVDGALALTATEYEGRQERWASLTKLRGVRIGTSAYPFTLEDAKFRAIVTSGARPAPSPIRDEPDPHPVADALWPGSNEFAAEFGRLPIRGTVLIETDGEAPLWVAWVLTAPTVLATLRAGGRVALRPPSDLSIAQLWRTISGAVTDGRASGSLRFLDVPPGADRAGLPAEVLMSDADVSVPTDGGRQAAAVDFLRSAPTPGPANLAVIFPHGNFGAEAEANLPDPYLGLPSRARRAGAPLCAIVVLRSDDAHIAPARVRSSVHLALRARRGQFFLYGVRPWTPLFVLRFSGLGPHPRGPYDLVPMV